MAEYIPKDAVQQVCAREPLAGADGGTGPQESQGDVPRKRMGPRASSVRQSTLRLIEGVEMKRAAGLLVTLAVAAGCASTGDMVGLPGGGLAGGPTVGSLPSAPPAPPPLRGAVGPWGETVRMTPPVGPHAPGAVGPVGPEVVQASMPPAGIPGLMPPAAIPGLPGVVPVGGAVASGAAGANAAPAFPVARTQVRFVGPAGAKIGWYVPGPAGTDGKPVLLPHQLDVPGRYNFLQASIYRLKLSDIPGRPGLALYPSLEVVPGNPKTEAFLAHNSIPVEFTEEDFDQVTAGNYITKVIYLPDPQYQTPAEGGVDTLVSTRLEPGQDPCAEAMKRGHILLVVRLGGIDLETANTPPLDNPGPFGLPRAMNGMMPMPQGPMTPPAMASVPTLPGVVNPVPPGLPGMPPVVTPPMPRFDAPQAAPPGPMVPAKPGTLPPANLPGAQSSSQASSAVQQTAYQIGSDGRRYPVPVPSTQEVRFPQTTIPAPSQPNACTDCQNKQRRGILDDLFGK